MLDLTNSDAVRYTKDTLKKKNMLNLGMRGWMADFGEYLPADCVLHDGDPKLLHNKWPVMWAKLNREAIEEYGRDDVFFFTRSGYTGIQSYAPIMRNGDQHTDTTHDYGMPSVMPASFSLGFSSVSLVHCDIGGFFSFMKRRRDDELFVRWMEMSTFSPLMRSHESIRPWANSQFDAPDAFEHTVRLTRLHEAIKPYVKHCAEQARCGIPAIRPDFWAENSFDKHRDDYSYFFGDDVFVEIDTKEYSTWFNDVQFNHDFDITCAATTANAHTTNSILSNILLEGGVNNLGLYSNSEVTALLKQAIESYDDAEKQEIYDKICDIMLEDCPVIALATTVTSLAANSDLQGVVCPPVGSMYFYDWSWA